LSGGALPGKSAQRSAGADAPAHRRGRVRSPPAATQAPLAWTPTFTLGGELAHLLELVVQLFLGPDLYLPRTLPRKAEMVSHFLQGHRSIGHRALFDDVALPVVEAGDRRPNVRADQCGFLLVRVSLLLRHLGGSEEMSQRCTIAF